MSRASGRVFIVGAGPGDPGLLTVRGAELIGAADDLVVDALVPAAVYRDSAARIVYVGKRGGRPSISQREIESILVRLARAGRTVVRLKGGDPSVFGRVSEEARALYQAGVDYEVVPGVSSALAAPLALGVAVTERDVADRVTVMTGHRRCGGEEVPSLPTYDARQTVVLLMALGNLEALVGSALAEGYPSTLPAVAISRATMPDQRSVAEVLQRLPAAVAAAALETPATVVIGAVAQGLLSQETGEPLFPASLLVAPGSL